MTEAWERGKKEESVDGKKGRRRSRVNGWAEDLWDQEGTHRAWLNRLADAGDTVRGAYTLTFSGRQNAWLSLVNFGISNIYIASTHRNARCLIYIEQQGVYGPVSLGTVLVLLALALSSCQRPASL